MRVCTFRYVCVHRLSFSVNSVNTIFRSSAIHLRYMCKAKCLLMWLFCLCIVVVYCHDFSNSLKTISGISEMHKLQKHPFMVLIFVVTCHVCCTLHLATTLFPIRWDKHQNDHAYWICKFVHDSYCRWQYFQLGLQKQIWPCIQNLYTT